jgi:deoxyribodipyrimidine photo-lyase
VTIPVLLWLRQDLRLADQPALAAAVNEGSVIPVYVLDDETPGDWATGGAQRWWLHHSLDRLAHSLKAKGSRLILRRGPADAVLRDLMAETGATRIHAIRHYEPWWRTAEAALGNALCLHDGNHLVPIEQVRNGAGQPYRMYSAFWRALQQQLPPAPSIPAPDTMPSPTHWPESDTLATWDLRPHNPDWATGFGEAWTPGEAKALAKAKAWADNVHAYAETRDLPTEEGTSLLSPHLHFGEISARALYALVHDRAHAGKFLKELAWRDFTDGVILALPDYGHRNGRPKYDTLRWRTDAAAKRDLRAWQQGRTGYPIVDAGMRQLWSIGWMHNRVFA